MKSLVYWAAVNALVAAAGGSATFAGPNCEAGFTGGLEMQNWSSTGIVGGTTNIVPISGPAGSATFGYDVNLGNPGPGVTPRTATFSVPAPYSGAFSFDYDYAGFHAFFQATANLRVFADSSSGTTTITIVDQATSGNFDFSGFTSIDIEQGFSFGFIVGGANGDTNSVLHGDLIIFNSTVTPTATPSPTPATHARGSTIRRTWTVTAFPMPAMIFRSPVPS